MSTNAHISYRSQASKSFATVFEKVAIVEQTLSGGKFATVDCTAAKGTVVRFVLDSFAPYIPFM